MQIIWVDKYLGDFYLALKGTDKFLRFIFLTGVTKEELLHNFQPELHALAENNEQTYEEAVSEMKQRYDGYHFARSFY
jgi:hypothetical protein